MQVAQLTYRLFVEEDIPGLLSLWEKFSGWGGISEQQFYDWHINTPNGPCTIVVAQTQDGDIIGQMVFRPTKVLINGSEVIGYRVMAPILNTNFRESDLRSYDHPSHCMIRLGNAHAIANNIQVIFFSPSIGWVPILKVFPGYGLPDTQVALFDCIGIDVSKIKTVRANETGLLQAGVGKISEKYEKLWERFIVNNNINNAICRSADWLQWRRGDDLVLEVNDVQTQELKGVVIIKKNTGQVVELIAENITDIKLTLIAVSNWLYQNSNEIKISEIKLMLTPIIEQAVCDLPVHSINYRFAFVCFNPQNKELPLLRDWFIMPDE